MRRHITRILSALLAVVLLAGALETITVRANDFSDIPTGHWAESYITRAFNEGVIAGTAYDRTTGAHDFSPLTPMTYAQFATILSRKYYADEYTALCETYAGENWAKPADYSLLLNAKSEIERTYDISARSRGFDKVYAIYHYLTQNFTYDYGLFHRSGAARSEAINAFNHPAGENYLLTNRMGVCVNFAMTFDSLCKIFDLESEYISGDVTYASDGHAWDIVKVDGTWYWVDSTWDEHGVRTVDKWQYFLVNDAKMAEQHIWTRSDYPVCARYYDTSKENMPSYTSNEQLPTGGTEYFQAPFSTRTRSSNYTLELSVGETYEITEADPFYEQYMANVSDLRSEVRGTNTGGVSTRYKKFIAESACDIYMTYHFSSGDYTLHIIVK